MCLFATPTVVLAPGTPRIPSSFQGVHALPAHHGVQQHHAWHAAQEHTILPDPLPARLHQERPRHRRPIVAPVAHSSTNTASAVQHIHNRSTVTASASVVTFPSLQQLVLCGSSPRLRPVLLPPAQHQPCQQHQRPSPEQRQRRPPPSRAHSVNTTREYRWMSLSQRSTQNFAPGRRASVATVAATMEVSPSSSTASPRS